MPATLNKACTGFFIWGLHNKKKQELVAAELDKHFPARLQQNIYPDALALFAEKDG
ncbi:MAG: hypothetical protein HQQ73_01945 [Desulfobulbaceae bacterium]|nr:hypothetical protein [Desulfobulbaceae bacterium]